VQLRKADGNTIELDLEQLSSGDRRFLWTDAPQQKLANIPSNLRAFARSMHAMRSVESERIDHRIRKLRQHLRAGTATRTDPIGLQAREQLQQLTQRFEQLQSSDPFLPRISPRDVEVGQVGELDDDLQFAIQADPETGSRRLLATTIEFRYINRLPGGNSPKLRHSWHKAAVVYLNVFELDTDIVRNLPPRQLNRILNPSDLKTLRSKVYRVVAAKQIGERKLFRLEPLVMDEITRWMDATTHRRARPT